MEKTAGGRVGEICRIDGKDAFATFGADLAECALSLGKASEAHQRISGSADFIHYGADSDLRQMKLRFVVGGESDDEAEQRMSNLMKACRRCEVTRESSDMAFDGFLTDCSREETGIEHYFYLEIALAGTLRGAEQVVYLSDSGSYENGGNVASGCVVSILPAEDLAELTVAGITLRNLKAGERFVIDGVKKEITCEGKNRFLDTNLTAFPAALPGENRVELSTPVPVEIAFRPTYL
ncbi:hypothetical protein [Bittarella massiliensis (ex Durand et al. 2017)]|uniref:hypothetical protein n=1 Tax=Bittarella massiliensis (ex Durand et al. 2017) TaxID=1720313 RepID=UPI00073E9914|nr:hypothetical protein [Bittarella massiliensis (ex Durand et al. 2017)]